jgi:protocatechuate 3,4-dioxygenase beta subunit
MKALWLLLGSLLAGVVCGQTTDGDKKGALTGIVRDSVTHVPVKKAMVSINPMFATGIGPANAGRNQGPQSTVTDASGTFTMANLSPGQYRVMIQHQNYPQARFSGVTKSVEVKAGETAGPLAVDLIPGAAVSGRIVDEEGEPIQGCFVQPHTAKNPDQGAPSEGNPSTNEDGDYRFYSVPPGKYILTAQCQTTVFQPRPFSSGPDPPPSRAYPLQYYPLATNPKEAEAVELTPGNEKSGVDFRMRPAPVTQIHGFISPDSAEWKGRNLNLQLMWIDPSRRNGMNFGAGIDQTKGTFEFQQVFPGSYTLVAFSNDGGEDKRIGVSQRIEVSDRPLDVVLELHPAFELTGKVELDANSNNNANTGASGNIGVGGNIPGGAQGRAVFIGLNGPASNGKPSLSQVGIQLFPAYQMGMPFPQTQVSEDGSFTLKGVIPGVWRLQVNTPLAFVKSAWIGSAEVTNGPLDLSKGATGALRIVLSTNTGTIRGSAPAGQTIFAQRIDDDVPFRSSRATQTDPSGQYTLSNLSPGKYRLVPADPGGPMPDEDGQEVTVREGETVMLDLKAPAGQ